MARRQSFHFPRLPLLRPDRGRWRRGAARRAELGLGILREVEGKATVTSASVLPSNVRAFARLPRLLYITKATPPSPVHRPGSLDYIGVKRFNERGEVCGEHRFLGLFTSTAYSAKPSEIPLLRRKTANVIYRTGIPPGGHTG